MICRSTLAGIVFTVAIPGLLSVGADVVGALLYGLENAAAIDRFRLLVFWRGMFVICAFGAVAGWRMFMRLEVIEGHSQLHIRRLGRDVAALRSAGATTLDLGAFDERASRPADDVCGRGPVRAPVCLSGVAGTVGPDTPFRLLVPLTLLYSRHAGDAHRIALERRGAPFRNARVADPAADYRHGSNGPSRSASSWARAGARGWPATHARAAAALRGEDHRARRAANRAGVSPGHPGTIYVSTLCKSGISALVWSFASVAGTIAFVRVLLDTAERLVIRPLVVSGYRLAAAGT